MKIQQARSTMGVKGDRTCRHCRLAIKSGEWYATTTMPNNPITDRWFNLHVRCMKALVTDVPADVNRAQENFDKIRAKGYTALRNEILNTN